jgi:hypothetical protein
MLVTGHGRNDVNTALTSRRRKRPTRYVESIDFLAMVRRIVRAAGHRVGDGDADELRALVAIRQDLDAAITEAVRGLKDSGATWSEIGAIQGVSKQAAEQWYSRRLEAERSAA